MLVLRCLSVSTARKVNTLLSHGVGDPYAPHFPEEQASVLLPASVEPGLGAGLSGSTAHMITFHPDGKLFAETNIEKGMGSRDHSHTPSGRAGALQAARKKWGQEKGQKRVSCQQKPSLIFKSQHSSDSLCEAFLCSPC